MSRTVPAARLLSLPRGGRVRTPTPGDTFGDLTSAFRFSHSRPRAPRLPDDTAEHLERAKEKGRRPHV
ncbi:hypothetical protein QF035_006683 [Streptomyces umbrinus]|uniref:Uncharacterized protein n=1 Tax=Streptomyces umbrinus TaxID=67370 RepID=A0ABU0SZX9_9ACTN|nr:hypothetical protein [Streptomyces umbrinus]MDQ1029101.1 hypothetical protein [Streptomyces umbrinus]